ncbi:hypothetical protein LTSEGIV_5574 [Salmonella enterica subsp. enterica serovar Give str. S5-487]|nr:hypothetical protein LTSEGIV_5574 [Salmonella enterica subsp. enterica serovar Give str. S5-487]
MCQIKYTQPRPVNVIFYYYSALRCYFLLLQRSASALFLISKR